MKKKLLSLLLCAAMLLSALACLASCSNSNSTTTVDTLVIMTEALDGLFNPFFSTSGADSTIVSMTQIGMLTSKYVNESVEVAYGENEAVAVKDYESKYDKTKNETVYTLVLKNGILYSDGHPLTMEDVLFNMYVYLDPVYTGSSTMYSTDIKGLDEYRTQTIGSSSSSDPDSAIAQQAARRAQDRINELVNLFKTFKTNSGYSASVEDMKNAIKTHSLSSGYKAAISNDASAVTNENLLADYNYALEKFKEELKSDYVTAQSAYTEEPYKSRQEFSDPIACFMYLEGFATVEWAKDANNKPDKSKIENVKLAYPTDSIKDEAAAIDYVFNNKVTSSLHEILTYWATAQKLLTEYSAKAKEVILHANIKDGQLKVDHIEGIVSLGHNASTKGTTISVNGNTYKVASAHNSDGTVANADEYDVLQITINGVDPKAIWNFSFAVAPQHYYGKGSRVGVDIENNKFGVEYGSFEFMTDVVQSYNNIKLPMGAGPYKVTNRDNSDTPNATEFFSNNLVYFKSNENFNTVGSGLNNANIKKVRYQVVSANNAIGMLQSGQVDYITPQLTTRNYDDLTKMSKDGIKFITDDQLGYGYIGINATKVPDINLRKAIMCAMNTTLALNYYRSGTAEQIYWPMSTVSWAYPKGDDGKISTDNGRDYPQINGRFNEATARQNITKYMEDAGVSAGDPQLTLTFTIAGSNLQDHPTYTTFRDAAALLNELGWDITVVPDTQALTKINTGDLAVWAAAWGSALDPDMYQVYHKNSTATSTLAWGYPSIKASGSAEEKKILNELSDLIDKGRETLDQKERAAIYKQAMGKVLDLAIELPVYQRSVIYAYNSKVLDSASMPSESEMNPYTSPLDRIWELELVK